MNLQQFRKWFAIGTGVGVEIRDDDLEVVVVRVRPGGVKLLGAATIPQFRTRPAQEWGAEYAGFVKRTGGSHLAATVLLPRRETIVRQLALPGVADRDLEAAIRYQIDSLHPYPEDEAAWAWTRIPRTPSVLIAIARLAAVEGYVTLFGEAGIKVASFTVSAAAVYSAARLLSVPKTDGFIGLYEAEDGVEVYGESPTWPVFSAAFDAAPERARALAAAELRIDPEMPAVKTLELLPAPRALPQDYDLSRANADVRDRAGRGMPPAGAVGEPAAGRTAQHQLAADLCAHRGTGRAAAGGGRRLGRLRRL